MTNFSCNNFLDENNGSNKNDSPANEIPVEVISEEEMAFIEAALLAAVARPSLHLSSSSSSSLASSSSTSSAFSLLSSQFQSRNGRCISSVNLLSNRSLRTLSGPHSGLDIEDSCQLRNAQKKSRVSESLLNRFRRRKGLSVTDITATEWCEKQMEFLLLLGKPEVTKAMKTGKMRHAKLEEEVIKRVEVSVRSLEDVWALKFMNFILGANQLLFEGLTRELPLVGFVEGAWMVGVIDELRMPVTGMDRYPILVDTKTRAKAKLPAEPQRRNGRLQLMCYKYLWDNLVSETFPSDQFFDWFSLNPNYVLSDDVKKSAADSGFPAETLDELMRYFRNTCSVLPPAHNQLLLRYELQEDNSLLGEDQFAYDVDWVKNQIEHCLKFWVGEQEASYVSEEERWKCHFCQFASVCPSQNDPSNALSSQNQ